MKRYCKIRNREFESMRKSGRETQLINMVQCSAPTTFKKLKYVPYAFRQEIPDPYDFKFIQLMDLLERGRCEWWS